jgi:outer membrane lipoprotein-sorting protein
MLFQDWQPDGDLGTLLSSHYQQFSRIEDLKVRAQVSVRVDGRDERATALLLYAKPNMFRFDVRGPLFSHILTAVMHDDSLTVVTSQGSWRGDPSSSLRRMIGIDLGGYDLGHLLLGVVQPAAIDSNRSIAYPRADRAVVPIVHEEAARTVTVDLFRGFIVAERFASSRTTWHREITAYRRLGNSFLPGKMSIWQDDNRLLLEYGEIHLNRGIPREEFLRGIPASTAPVQEAD